MEALSATGLRSIRYYNEITPQVDQVVANDLKPEAAEAIRINVVRNGLDPESQVIPSCGDANIVMMQAAAAGEHYDVVDLDPYGSAAPFLNATMMSVADGGLLAVTCTDMAVLAGARPETCFSKYGSMPLHKRFCHEGGVRILLASLERAASLHKKYIEPLLSCSIDFYSRVFVRVHTSAAESKRSALRLSQLYACGGCAAFHWQPLGREKPAKSGKTTHVRGAYAPTVGSECSECGGRFQLGGPYWAGELHSRPFVRRVLDTLESDHEAYAAKFATLPRMMGRLVVCHDELEGSPLYYDLPSMLSALNLTPVKKDEFMAGLVSLGYEVTETHASVSGFKTNAPAGAVYDVLRAWAAKFPPVRAPASVEWQKIIAREVNSKVSFDTSILPKASSQKRRLSKFPQNPEAFWGPKMRATGQKRKPGDESATGLLPAQMERQRSRQKRKARMCRNMMDSGACGDEACTRVHPTPEQRAAIRDPELSRKEKGALLRSILHKSEDDGGEE
ncbi:N2,N2-dimethylguanosine tRNA methyltransferase [Thecamonas trahens ATCC 50062]|uniref:tRNA (guanine(26)-N(2))-dimethyltransferase n=1 Tax=Thecamonas trahens ATCC 50062 TaxID=461836 RepID=A0A0L0D3S6_THETB|nr:N2,N2-dimethylguanosine tRNA methyltransferase [Thecamonas trahens ATCC 50062]KNC46997.1 N2,N2-dimethylguanosine tRNA methyltransferase [Thecamonas trahens ATCC 50062]|eukprot:XP_013759780.1 N2,N2-dimethylguanosine tRNA methyltransferase [Thecamonas trahens ATCC 50062]